MSNPTVAQLNPVLFGSADILQVVKGLTDRPVDALSIEAELGAAGVEPQTAERLNRLFWREVYDAANAAFLAGYLAGRDPDKLVLGRIGSPYRE